MTHLLREFFEFRQNEKTLNELKTSVVENKPFVITGIIQRADQKNQNGRIYPYEILKKECDRYLEEMVRNKISYGELDHRDNPVIEMKNASHLIEDLWWGGDDQKEVWGKIRVLNTPAGQIVKNIVLDGFPIGISSRAVGSVSRNESTSADVVQDDLQLICFDLVGTPSTHNAFLKLHENFNPRKILPREIRVKETLKELLKK